MEQCLELNHKKLGVLNIDQHNLDQVNAARYKPYIKMLYLPAGYKLKVDFRQFTTRMGSLFLSIPTNTSSWRRPVTNPVILSTTTAISIVCGSMMKKLPATDCCLTISMACL